MSAVYADLVVPDLTVDDFLQHRTLSWVEQHLRAVRDQPHLGPLWSDAEFLGLDHSASFDHVPRQACGVSWQRAPIAGIGFAREDYLEPTAPPDPTDAGLIGRDASDATRRARYRRRAPEIAAVHHATRVSNGGDGLPLVAAIDLQGTARFDFRQGYRRRLAHVLAYEASLRAGSHTPYRRHFPALIEGTVHQLRTSLDRVPMSDAFSVILNLTATLREAATYQDAIGTAHPDLGMELTAADAKTTLLTGQLAKAADRRRLTLHSDARRALTALWAELARTGDIAYTGATLLPTWGLLADADNYT